MAWMWGSFAGFERNLLPLNALAGAPRGPPIGVIIIYAVRRLLLNGIALLSNRPLRTTIDHLTSNQVGLPAELKHINKRRKRN